jgi:hypothetical protein
MKPTNRTKKNINLNNYVTIYKTCLYNLIDSLKLPIYRYSSRSLLNKLDVTSKFKAGNYILNNNQKPIHLFMTHILCWSDEGDLIIDATSGTWTMAVSIICSFVLYFVTEKFQLSKICSIGCCSMCVT